ncbi:MAG: hypothetical protein ACM3KR_03085 [Deltaproteobacteria bacterium]
MEENDKMEGTTTENKTTKKGERFWLILAIIAFLALAIYVTPSIKQAIKENTPESIQLHRQEIPKIFASGKTTIIYSPCHPEDSPIAFEAAYKNGYTLVSVKTDRNGDTLYFEKKRN